MTAALCATAATSLDALIGHFPSIRLAMGHGIHFGIKR